MSEQDGLDIGRGTAVTAYSPKYSSTRISYQNKTTGTSSEAARAVDMQPEIQNDHILDSAEST